MNNQDEIRRIKDVQKLLKDISSRLIQKKEHGTKFNIRKVCKEHHLNRGLITTAYRLNIFDGSQINASVAAKVILANRETYNARRIKLKVKRKVNFEVLESELISLKVNYSSIKKDLQRKLVNIESLHTTLQKCNDRISNLEDHLAQAEEANRSFKEDIIKGSKAALETSKLIDKYEELLSDLSRENEVLTKKLKLTTNYGNAVDENLRTARLYSVELMKYIRLPFYLKWFNKVPKQ